MIGGGVAASVEPTPATVAVVPPFLLDASDVGTKVEIICPLVLRGTRRRAAGHLASKAELLDAAFTAVGAI